MMITLTNSKKKEFSSDIRGLLKPLFIVLMIVLLSPDVFAQESDYQVNWTPNRYKLECFFPFKCIYGDGVHERTERLMPQVVSRTRALKFAPPAWFGKRVRSEDEGDYIELKETMGGTIASTTARCLKANIEYSFIEIGSQFEEWEHREDILFYFMAHEFFHVLQNERDFVDPTSCANVPGWIKEGTATAVGQAVTRKQYPNLYPEKTNKRVARNFAGLRRYDEPLNHREYKNGKEVLSGEDIYYRTSSFWRHLADIHYAGRYDFLEKYMQRTNTGKSWTGWLRNNVKEGTGEDLSMVFGGFLADYAGWGDKGLPGQVFKRKTWLYETFNGCQRIKLNRYDATGYVEFDLLPLSGKCVQVDVPTGGGNGIQAGESAAVQIAAVIMSGAPSARGGLQLGLASTNDKTGFHCARALKDIGKKALGRCLFVPDDGAIRLGGGPVQARVWNVFAQQKSDPAEIRQETGKPDGDMSNLYTII